VGSGRILRQLTPLPTAGLFTSNAYDGTEGTVAADRAGRYLLIAGAGTGTGAIFRWTFGQPHPIMVISDAIRAAWA
jgi:hypothetical protein